MAWSSAAYSGAELAAYNAGQPAYMPWHKRATAKAGLSVKWNGDVAFGDDYTNASYPTARLVDLHRHRQSRDSGEVDGSGAIMVDLGALVAFDTVALFDAWTSGADIDYLQVRVYDSSLLANAQTIATYAAGGGSGYYPVPIVLSNLNHTGTAPRVYTARYLSVRMTNVASTAAVWGAGELVIGRRLYLPWPMLPYARRWSTKAHDAAGGPRGGVYRFGGAAAALSVDARFEVATAAGDESATDDYRQYMRDRKPWLWLPDQRQTNAASTVSTNPEAYLMTHEADDRIDYQSPHSRVVRLAGTEQGPRLRASTYPAVEHP
jgi:hypothetical protein